VVLVRAGAKGHQDIPSFPSSSLGTRNLRFNLKNTVGDNLLDALVNRIDLHRTWVTLVGAKVTVKRKLDGSMHCWLKSSDEQPCGCCRVINTKFLQSEISWLDERSKTKLAVVGEIDFAIMNKAQRHQINILLKLPKKYGDELRVSMDLNAIFFKPHPLMALFLVEGKKCKAG